MAKAVFCGWQIAGNDQVKVQDIGSQAKVSFIHGNGTEAIVTKDGDCNANVTFNVNQTTLTQNVTTGDIETGKAGDYFPTATTVAEAINSTRIKYFSVNSTEPGNRLNDGAKAKDSIAIGMSASVIATNMLSIGNAAKA